MSELRRVRAVVRGRVQGVGFRASAQARARSLGLAGWVRNTLDGQLEAELEGPPDRVDSLLRWLEQGPRGARVEGVSVERLEPTGGRGFSVR